MVTDCISPQVHAALRAVACRMEVADFVAFLRQVSALLNTSHFCAARRHQYSADGFSLQDGFSLCFSPELKHRLLVEYGRGSTDVAFSVPYDRRTIYANGYVAEGYELPRCRSEWSLDQIVDAVLCIGFDFELLTLIPDHYHRLGEILGSLVDGGRVFGVLPEQEVADLLFQLFTWEDDRMDELAQIMRDGGRVRYPPSLIALLFAAHAAQLHDRFDDNRYNHEVRYTLMEDVVAPLSTFLDTLHFPADFSAAERQPIFDALSGCKEELKEGLRSVALSWIDHSVGGPGDAPLSADALESVRAICVALRS